MVPLAPAIFACLTIVMHVHEPANVVLSVHENVRLDRVVQSVADAPSVQREGGLFRPGSTNVLLQPGVYQLRSGTDVAVHVAKPDAATVSVQASRNDKDIPPDPKFVSEFVSDKGFSKPDVVPALTVTYGE